MSYRNDPRWVTVRNPIPCPKCDRYTPAGGRAVYYPLSKTHYCQTCGDPMAREFEAMRADEASL